MTSYAPCHGTCWLELGVALGGAVALGFVLTRLPTRRLARAFAWLQVLTAVVVADRLTANAPPPMRMLAIITLLLVAMKAVVAVEERNPALSLRQWLGFVTWPGMRPSLFAVQDLKAARQAGHLLGRGLVRVALGTTLILLARIAWGATSSRLLATALLLPGVSLGLHFGLFNILAAVWRWRGVACEPLFRAPLAATTLTEFWGRRWNIGFSEMTASAVYRPLSAVVGKSTATLAAFLFSGLLHELAISLPVRAGYGLPSLYFALHGMLMLVERRRRAQGRGIEAMGWMSHVWVIAWLSLPLPLLFHRPFLAGVVWPLLGIPGAH